MWFRLALRTVFRPRAVALLLAGFAAAAMIGWLGPTAGAAPVRPDGQAVRAGGAGVTNGGEGVTIGGPGVTIETNGPGSPADAGSPAGSGSPNSARSPAGAGFPNRAGSPIGAGFGPAQKSFPRVSPILQSRNHPRTTGNLPGSTLALPVAVPAGLAAPAGLAVTTTVMSENYEGTWPAGSWQTSDRNGATDGEYTWATSNCRGHQSSRSAWGMGGGANGRQIASCSANYPEGLASGMTFGPIDLSRATSAQLSFYAWINTYCVGPTCQDLHNDALFVGASPNGTDNWTSNWIAGVWSTKPQADANGWVTFNMDLKDYLGQSTVYIGFGFESDKDGQTLPGGVFVDDVKVDANLGNCPADTASIRSITTDRTCYAPGGRIGVFVDANTTLASQSVRAQVLLLSGDVAIASAEGTFSAPGQKAIALDVPNTAATGDYSVHVSLYDVNSQCIQDVKDKTVRIDPSCGLVTDVPGTHTATPTPTHTMRPPTPTPTHTMNPPTHTPTPTMCPTLQPPASPSCTTGLNYVRNAFYEQGLRSWGLYSSTGSDILNPTAAMEGFLSARFDGPFNQQADQMLYQVIDIPSDATAINFFVEYFLSGAAQGSTPMPTSGRDFFRVSLYDTTLTNELVRIAQLNPVSECPPDSPAYSLSPSDLARVRGHTVVLVFELRKITGAGWSTFVKLDGIHLQVCSPSPPCQVDRNKTASPSSVAPGGEVEVTLSLSGYGGACASSRKPADVMLVLDRSGSMSGQPFDDLVAAAKQMVDRLDLSTDQVGVVSFSSDAALDQMLTRQAGLARAAIDKLSADGDTNINQAIQMAQAELASVRHIGSNMPIMILMSDGQPTTGGDPLPSAAAAKSAGTRIFTVGLGSDIDPDLMRKLASAPTDYFFAPDSSQLDAIFQQIVGVLGTVPATNITITDRLSSYVTLIPNSFVGVPTPDVSPDGRTLTWHIPRLGMETKFWSYRVKMTQNPGTWPTNDSATATFTNSSGQPGNLTFPVPQVTVIMAPQHPQLMCRDHEKDDGMVPSNAHGESWWDSPDIWVRNQQDGKALPQNPIAGQTNWVYVRVHNTGDMALADITVHVHTAPGAANLRWPADWLPEIGSTIIDALAPGQDAVVAIPWTPVQQGHFCFLVRIDAPKDHITQDGWVPFDNNICQRNVQILDGPPPDTGIGAGFGAGNRNLGSGVSSLSVTSNNFPGAGTGVVKFNDPALFQRWQKAGGIVRGGQVIPGTESIRVDVQLGAGMGSGSGSGFGSGKVNLRLERIPFEGEETTKFELQVTGPAGAQPPTIQITQWVDGQAVGGNVIRPPVIARPIYLPKVARGQ